MPDDDNLDLGAALAGIDLGAALEIPTGIVENRAIRSRNGVIYLTAASWQRRWRSTGVAAVKAAKTTLAPSFCASVAADVAGVVEQAFGRGPMLSITNVACGHSCRPDCLSARISEAVAARLDAVHVRAFADRFVRGASHPKEFRRLPPLELVAIPTSFTVVVDDVATSGWHLEEAVKALRAQGVACAAVAWIGGEVSDEGRDRWQSQTE